MAVCEIKGILPSQSILVATTFRDLWGILNELWWPEWIKGCSPLFTAIGAPVLTLLPQCKCISFQHVQDYVSVVLQNTVPYTLLTTPYLKVCKFKFGTKITGVNGVHHVNTKVFTYPFVCCSGYFLEWFVAQYAP